MKISNFLKRTVLPVTLSAYALPATAVDFGMQISQGNQYNSNGLLNAEVEESQMLHTYIASFTAVEQSEALTLNFAGGYEYRDFRNETLDQGLQADNDVTTLNGGLNWNIIPQRLSFALNNTRRETLIDRDTNDVLSNRQIIHTIDAGPVLTLPVTLRDELVLSLQYGAVDIKDNRGDSTSQTASFSWNHQLTVLSTVFLSADFSTSQGESLINENFDDTDSDVLNVLLGFQTSGRRYAASASFGTSELNSEQVVGFAGNSEVTTMTDQNNDAWNASWNYQISERLTFSVASSQQTTITPGATFEFQGFGIISGFADAIVVNRQTNNATLSLNYPQYSLSFGVFQTDEDFIEDVEISNDREVLGASLDFVWNWSLLAQADLGIGISLDWNMTDRTAGGNVGNALVVGEVEDEFFRYGLNVNWGYQFNRKWSIALNASYSDQNFSNDLSSNLEAANIAFLDREFDAITAGVTITFNPLAR